MDAKRGVFRVNYQENGQPKTGLVAAFTDVEAASFLGVESQSGVQVTKALYPVEVAGVDPDHAIIPSIAPTTAPFDLPKSVSREDFNALKAELDALKAQIGANPLTGGQLQPLPNSGGPTLVQPGPTAAKE